MFKLNGHSASGPRMQGARRQMTAKPKFRVDLIEQAHRALDALPEHQPQELTKAQAIQKLMAPIRAVAGQGLQPGRDRQGALRERHPDLGRSPQTLRRRRQSRCPSQEEEGPGEAADRDRTRGVHGESTGCAGAARGAHRRTCGRARRQGRPRLGPRASVEQCNAVADGRASRRVRGSAGRRGHMSHGTRDVPISPARCP